MTGMEMLLKNALTAVFKAMGVTGEEIVQKFEELKTAIPAFAQQAQEKLLSIDTRLDATNSNVITTRQDLRAEVAELKFELNLINQKLDALLKIDSDPHTLPAGTGAASRADDPNIQWPVLSGDHAAQEDGKWIATNGGIHAR